MKIFKKIFVAGFACLLLCFGVAMVGCGVPPISNGGENLPSIPPIIETPDTGDDSNGGGNEKPPVEEEKPPVEDELKVDFSEVLANLKEFLVDSGLLDSDLVADIDEVLDVKQEDNVLTVSISTEYLFSDDESMFDFSEDGFDVGVANKNGLIIFTISKI